MFRIRKMVLAHSIDGEEQFVFNDEFRADTDVEKTLRSIPVGWLQPPVRRETRHVPIHDGAFVQNGYWGERLLECEGTLVHQDRVETRAALKELRGLLADLIRQDGVFWVEEDDGLQYVTVRLADAMTESWEGPACEFSFMLVAADPRKYSTTEILANVFVFTTGTEAIELTADSGADLGLDLTVSTGINLGIDTSGATGGSDVEVENVGDIDVFPLIVMWGPASGTWTQARLRNLDTDENITISTTVGVDQWIRADMGASATMTSGEPITLEPDGVSRYSAWDPPRAPFRLVPGLNRLRFEVLAGTATGAYASVSFRSASI